MPTNAASVEFELVSGSVLVDAAVLRAMKAALLAFIDSAEYPARFGELRDTLRAELQRAAPWIAGGAAGLGLWRLQSQEGRLALVRYPPPAVGTTYLYHASLRRTEAGWRVESFEQERELGPQ